jgi:hypothetical protein
VAHGSSGHLGLYRLETQITIGNGALRTSDLGTNTAAREAIKVGFDYCKANASHVSASAKPGEYDFHLHVVELHNTGPITTMTLAAFVALCSSLLGKPVQSQLVILGSMSLGGSLSPVQNLAEALQVAFDAGAKRLLLPMARYAFTGVRKVWLSSPPPYSFGTLLPIRRTEATPHRRAPGSYSLLPLTLIPTPSCGRFPLAHSRGSSPHQPFKTP